MLKTCKFYSGSVGCNTLGYIIHCGKARQPWFGLDAKGDMTEYSIGTISDSSGAILLAIRMNYRIKKWHLPLATV
jgi:hypothetical protein